MVRLLYAQDEMRLGRPQVADVRRIAAQGVLDHDDIQMRMVFAERFEPAACAVSFTVVLVVAVLALILVGIFVYLFIIDKKIGKLEKEISEKESHNRQ